VRLRVRARARACSLIYLPSKARVSYNIVICGLSGCTIYYPHYLINGMIFGKTLLNVKYVFSFSLQLLSETFLIVRRTERAIIKNV